MFVPICLDNLSSKKISQLKIKEVPAIVVSCENSPSSIFEGPQQCSQWLTSLMYNRRKNICERVEKQRKFIQKKQAEMRSLEGGAIEYNAEEMDGISDNYAYNMTDLCQPKNFVQIGSEDKYNIVTPQTTCNKIDMLTMKKQLANLETSRKNDNNKFSDIMEKQQIQTILNSGFNN
jgi:hypothetical protein